MCYVGLALKSQLKVRAYVQSLPRLQLRIRSAAKSIAPCRMHSQKKKVAWWAAR